MFRIFKAFRRIIFLAIIFLAIYWYFTKNTPPSEPIAKVPDSAVQIDQIYVDKSDRKLCLLQKGVAVREYDIALGFAPSGQKLQEGDGKTPTGEYVIDYRNPTSSYHKSLHISYPRPDQRAAAKAEGRSPGGMIMIHGQPNNSPYKGERRISADWTAGCLAVSNNEIEEIWALVKDGTKITIVE